MFYITDFGCNGLDVIDGWLGERRVGGGEELLLIHYAQITQNAIILLTGHHDLTPFCYPAAPTWWLDLGGRKMGYSGWPSGDGI